MKASWCLGFLATAFLALSLVALSGCGGEVKPPRTKKAGGGVAAKTDEGSGSEGSGESSLVQTGNEPYPTAQATATVTGVVKLDGPGEKMRKIDMSADPKCKGEDMLFETVITGENNELANCVIYISKGVEKYSFPTPSAAAVIDQKGCKYLPHVVAIQTGQPVELKNSDPTLHNINCTQDGSALFNISQTPGKTDIKKLEDQGVAKLVCNVHPWMSGYARVLPHNLSAVTEKDGKFALPKLPPGKYTVTAWHEKLKTKSVEVEVADGESKAVEIVFPAK
ncbi:MAG: hypothetical protein AMXMBFR7_13600 [Planctomycetota bacterium]